MVVEAFNLLRQSIISVEKDDVEVDEEDEEMANGVSGHDRPDNDGDSPMGDGPDDDEDGDNGPDGGAGANSATPAPERKKTKITYDKYISVVNLLVQRVNEDELGSGEGVEGEKLVEWYLEQKEDELAGEEDYHAEKALVGKIIKRMVKVCRITLMTLEESLLTCETGKYLDGD
jgi:DNA replication licensing factor MCM6